MRCGGHTHTLNSLSNNNNNKEVESGRSFGASIHWLRPDMVLPAPFLKCHTDLTPGGSGVLADPGLIDEEFRKGWLPFFCSADRGIANLDTFT